MQINITGLNGRITGASLMARMGLKFGDKIITRVSDNEIVLSDANGENPVSKSELSVPYWLVEKDERGLLKTDGGRNQFYPTSAESALATILDSSKGEQASCLEVLNSLVNQQN